MTYSDEAVEKAAEAICDHLSNGNDTLATLTEYRRADMYEAARAALASLPSGGGVKMREALEPFARCARIQWRIAANWPDDKPAAEFIPGLWPTWGDFKRAANAVDALTPTPGDGDEGLIAEAAKFNALSWTRAGGTSTARAVIRHLASRLSELTGVPTPTNP